MHTGIKATHCLPDTLIMCNVSDNVLFQEIQKQTEKAGKEEARRLKEQKEALDRIKMLEDEKKELSKKKGCTIL